MAHKRSLFGRVLVISYTLDPEPKTSELYLKAKNLNPEP